MNIALVDVKKKNFDLIWDHRRMNKFCENFSF